MLKRGGLEEVQVMSMCELDGNVCCCGRQLPRSWYSEIGNKVPPVPCLAPWLVMPWPASFAENYFPKLVILPFWRHI